MAYYLTIKENNNYKLLDISSLGEFQRKSRFKDNAYTLEEIDDFTSSFDSELSLKRKLYENKIISLEDITKDISIRRKNKGKLQKVMYGLVYKNMKKYLDVYYLRVKLLELQSDINFLNKLLNHYRDNYNQENIAAIRNILLGNNDELNMFSALSDFYEKEIFKEDYKTGEIKIKYKSLHDLGMFICNYQNYKNKDNSQITSIELERKKELSIMQEVLNPKMKKKKVKKREELEGQTSFF